MLLNSTSSPPLPPSPSLLHYCSPSLLPEPVSSLPPHVAGLLGPPQRMSDESTGREGGSEGGREGEDEVKEKGRREDKGEKMKVDSKEEGGRRGRENDLVENCSYIRLLCPTTLKKIVIISFQQHL